MRFFLDTEFMEDERTIELISVGVVAEDGREYYAENSDFDWSNATDWLRANVWPHLTRGASLRTRTQIRDELLEFISVTLDKPEFWGYYSDYDWVVLCWLFGRMIDLPKKWPMYCMDIKQWAMQLGNPMLPKQDSAEHNALADARHIKDMYDFLVQKKPTISFQVLKVDGDSVSISIGGDALSARTIKTGDTLTVSYGMEIVEG